MKRVSTDRFNFEQNLFVTFHSDIQDKFKTIDRYITLVNPKTNGEMVFEFAGKETDGWDVVSWDYRSKSDPKIKILIFND